MIYPFVCSDCRNTIELHVPVSERDNLSPLCCGKIMDWLPSLAAIEFRSTVGRDSGFYELDYGKRATEDLTVPGKLERLTRDGRLGDPFAS